MPGQLKADAVCPVCSVPIRALMDETSARGVKRVLYHDKDPQRSPKCRRPLPCHQNFESLATAQRERRLLEVA
jgi:hypothetical protein